MLDDGSSFLSGLDFMVSDGMTAGPGGGAPSGGFSMSQSEMESLLAKAKATQNLITLQISKAQDIARIDPPGYDPKSGEITQVAIDAGRYYLGHLQIQSNRYLSLIRKLNLALGYTTEADEQNTDAMLQAGAEGKY